MPELATVDPVKRSSAPEPRPVVGSPLWIAAGAATTGVLIGGVAVYLGSQSALKDAATVPVDPIGPAVSTPEPRPEVVAAPAPPSLADAVATTWDCVVNLESSRGLGAGVIVDPTGIVLTNYHVIAEALRPPPSIFGTMLGERPVLSARFANDRRVGASVLVTDPDEDLAVLRLVPEEPGTTFEVARIGRSADLRVGQEVFAVGNPFGLRNTVSSGIVSAVDRTGVLDNEQRAMIQLDASVNVGNSGGPLFNLRGELVGIVTARRTEAEGIAFALPMDHVRGFLDAVQDPTGARSGVIGVTLASGTTLPESAVELGYRAGLVIDEAYEGGPAAVAGLRTGDVVVALRGKRLDGLPEYGSTPLLVAHLQKTVRGMFRGEILPVTVARGDAVLELNIEVATASPKDQAAIDAEELLGLSLDRGAETPTILEVRPGTPLARYSPMLERSTIESVMGTRVETLEALSERLTEVRRLRRTLGVAPRVRLGFRSPSGETGNVLLELR